VLDEQHVPGHGRGDVRVAVAVAADPGAERERGGGDRHLDAQLGQHRGQVGQHPRRRPGGELAQVVDRVARLVPRVGADQPQLIGLPQRVDELGQALLGAGPLALVRPVGRLAAGLGIELVGDGAQLGQDRPAGRLGGVGREDRPDAQVVGRGRNLAHGDPALADERGRPVQPATALGPGPPQLATPVGLLGDVGDVEVEREGAGELGGRGQVELGQPPGGRGPVRTDQTPDLFDQVEQLLPLLASQGLPEQHAQSANVGPQLSVDIAPRGAGLARPGGGRRHARFSRYAGFLRQARFVRRHASPPRFTGRRCPTVVRALRVGPLRVGTVRVDPHRLR